MAEPRIHELKTDPDIFDAVWGGDKRFELRFDDRNFAVGDRLILRETYHTGYAMADGAPLAYTGREVHAVIGYILCGRPGYGLADEWVIIQMDDMKPFLRLPSAPGDANINVDYKLELEPTVTKADEVEE